MRWLILFLVTGLVLANSIGADPKPDKIFKTIKPVVVLSGTDSTIMKEGFCRCTTEEEWSKLWHQHRDGKAPIELGQSMEVDFRTNMVIAIFQGNQSFYGAVGTVLVSENAEKMLISFAVNTASIGDGIKVEEVRPIKYEAGSYAFIIIPKSKKPIIFQIGKREKWPPGMPYGGNYSWAEESRLPALKD